MSERLDELREAVRIWDSWRRMVEKRYPDAFSLGQLIVHKTLAEAARAVLDGREPDVELAAWFFVDHFGLGLDSAKAYTKELLELALGGKQVRIIDVEEE